MNLRKDRQKGFALGIVIASVALVGLITGVASIAARHVIIESDISSANAIADGLIQQAQRLRQHADWLRADGVAADDIFIENSHSLFQMNSVWLFDQVDKHGVAQDSVVAGQVVSWEQGDWRMRGVATGDMERTAFTRDVEPLVCQAINQKIHGQPIVPTVFYADQIGSPGTPTEFLSNQAMGCVDLVSESSVVFYAVIFVK
jgi:Tfp pilus assembly protein PilE